MPSRYYCGVLCSRGAGVVGLGGIGLLVAGVLQAALGVYFVLTLPVFGCGSNIWTGALGLLVGTTLMHTCWSNRSNRRANLVLAAALLVLVINVINLVILQVGENRLFLSEKDVVYITAMELEHEVALGVWLSSGVTIFAILVSFVVAQIVFCISLKNSPHIKGHFSVASRYIGKNEFEEATLAPRVLAESEDFSDEARLATSRSRQVVLPRISMSGKSRFFPPSRLRASKDAYRPSTLSPVGAIRINQFSYDNVHMHDGSVGPSSSSAAQPLSLNNPHDLSCHQSRGDMQHECLPYIAPSRCKRLPLSSLNSCHSSVCCHKCRTACCECHQQSATDTAEFLHESPLTAGAKINLPVKYYEINDCYENDIKSNGEYCYSNSNSKLCFEDTFAPNAPVDTDGKADNRISNGKGNQNFVEEKHSRSGITDDDFDNLPYYGNYFSDDAGGDIGSRTVGASMKCGILSAGEKELVNYDADDDDVFDHKVNIYKRESNMYGNAVVLRNPDGRRANQYNTYSGRSNGTKRKSLKQRLSGKLKNKSKDVSGHDNRGLNEDKTTSRSPKKQSNGMSSDYTHLAVKRTISPPLSNLMHEENIPYFLRNHPETWKCVLPGTPLTSGNKTNGYEKPSKSSPQEPDGVNTAVRAKHNPHIITKYSTFKPLRNRQSKIEDSNAAASDVYSTPFDMITKYNTSQRIASHVPTPTEGGSTLRPRADYAAADSRIYDEPVKSRVDYSSDSSNVCSGQLPPVTLKSNANTIHRDRPAYVGSRRNSLLEEYADYIKSSTVESAGLKYSTLKSTALKSSTLKSAALKSSTLKSTALKSSTLKSADLKSVNYSSHRHLQTKAVTEVKEEQQLCATIYEIGTDLTHRLPALTADANDECFYGNDSRDITHTNDNITPSLPPTQSSEAAKSLLELESIVQDLQHSLDDLRLLQDEEEEEEDREEACRPAESSSPYPQGGRRGSKPLVRRPTFPPPPPPPT